MTAIVPTFSNGWLIQDETPLGPETLNGIFGEIKQKLTELFSQAVDGEATLNNLVEIALEYLAEAIGPQIASTRDLVTALEQAIATAEDKIALINQGGLAASAVTVAEVPGLTARQVQAAIAEIVQAIAGIPETLTALAPKYSPEFTGTVKLPNGLEIKSDTLPFGIVKRKARTADAALGSADFACLIDITAGTFTQTFAAAATLGDGWWCYLRNSGTGDVTLSPTDAETIDGLASYVMYPGECRIVLCDGTALRSVIINAFYKVFTTSTTFVKPPGYQAFEGLIWGGGASGKRSTSNRSEGGPGAGCAPLFARASSVAASEPVTIGAGGVGSATTSFNPGGNSSFVGISAFGGAANGGGAAFFSDVRTNSGSPIIGGAGFSQFSVEAYWGGGCIAVTSINNPMPLRTVYGGGAGGGPGDSIDMIAPPATIFGGRGGVGSVAANGADGEAPGGGGGGTRTGTAGGAGARGELRLWGII